MKFFRTLLLTLVLVSQSCSTRAPNTPFKIVGYWSGGEGAADTFAYDGLTHVNYAFAVPKGDGSVILHGKPATLKQMVEIAHTKNIKALIAIGGWDVGDGGGVDTAFENMAATKQSRVKFVRDVLAMVERYGLDGVDIDWEYPDAGTSALRFDTLMTSLGRALHERGKLLSVAVVAAGGIGESILPSVFQAVDFLNVMAYDYRPFPHSSLEVAQKSLQYWLGRGLPKEKTVLGVPFYCRAPNRALGYKDVVKLDASLSTKDAVDSCTYNGIPTMKAKTKLALEKGGGIMIWEMSLDTRDSTSLLKAIVETAKKAYFR